MSYKAVVIGVSLGGLKALQVLLPALPADFSMPVVIVQHIDERSSNEWIHIIGQHCLLNLKEADEKEDINPGTVYFAPANYHLLIERDKTFSLSTAEKVNFARPSIDVLFECAADAYGEALIGIILTGLNMDGARGLQYIKQSGGMAIIQDPSEAQAAEMPQNALDLTPVDHILKLREIAPFLKKIDKLNKTT